MVNKSIGISENHAFLCKKKGVAAYVNVFMQPVISIEPKMSDLDG